MRLQLKRTIRDVVGGIWGDEPGGAGLQVPIVRVADFDYPALSVSDPVPTIRSVPNAKFESRRLSPGDLLLEKSGGGEKQNVGRVVVWRGSGDACCSNFVSRMRPLEGFDPQYLAYVHSAAYRRGVASANTRQTTGIQNLNVTAYLSEEYDFPELREQRRLAASLDTEMRRISDLKARLTAALTAAHELHRDDCLRLTDAHQRRLKYVLSRRPAYGASESTTSGEPEWPRFIRITDIGPDGSLRSGDVKRLSPDIASSYMLEDGDVLVARSGATVGKSFRYQSEVHEPAAFAGYLIQLRCNRSVLEPAFLDEVCKSTLWADQVGIVATQATIPNVSAAKYAEFQVPVPSLAIQRDFLQRLAPIRTRERMIAAQVELTLSRLDEYFASLVDRAVSGDTERAEQVDDALDMSAVQLGVAK